MESMILEPLREQARRAYSGISFSPEKRAQSIVNDYSEELTEDLLKIKSEEGKEQYKSKYISLLSSWLSAKGRCLSPMITGPARFPTDRNNKANNSESKRYDEFRDWREYKLKSIAKTELAARSPEQVTNEKWNSLQKSILSSAATIFGIDNGTHRGYARTLFVNSITGLVKRVAQSGDTENVKRMLDLIRTLNTSKHATKPIITDKNSIWSLGEVAEASREQLVDNSLRGSDIVKFEGGEVVYNYQADRIQILHDKKPEPSVIQSLKKNAFRWSPSNMAWQRQLTNAGVYAAMDITGLELKRV